MQGMRFLPGVQEFLSIPVEEKKKFWQTPQDIEGFGQMFVVSEDHKLEWADLFLITTLPLYARNSRLFPSIPQPFRDDIQGYCLAVEKLCFTIIKHMEKALKIESNELTGLFDDMTQAMRWNYYPPCPQQENVIGLNPHSDVGGLTILLQINKIEGLQVRKDGMWIPVQPLPNAFIINYEAQTPLFSGVSRCPTRVSVGHSCDTRRTPVYRYQNKKLFFRGLDIAPTLLGHLTDTIVLYFCKIKLN